MNINGIEKASYIYGPEERYVIWVQGCSIKCKGCWNKEMWSFERKKDYDIKELLVDIKENNTSGVTILGGEPLDQYLEVLEFIKKLYFENISIILYSGYKKEKILEEFSEIVEYLDILISGPYIEEERDISLQWRGSRNQEIDFISDRYSKKILKDANYVEFILEENGEESVLGFLSDKLEKELK